MDTKDKDAELEAYRKLVHALGDYVVNSESTLPACKFCGSDKVVRNGHRKGTQYWLCKHCGHGFVANDTLPRSHFPMSVMSKALYDYYAGMSLNAICEGIKQDKGLSVSDTTVYGWLEKYTPIALEEAKRYPPKVGKKWIMDETVVTMDGKKYWLITALDEQTRYLLGTKVSTNRNYKDIQEVLERATDLTGTLPDIVLTDGWGGYRDAIERAYGADANHVVSKPFAEAELSTNLMERWNGTLKDRLKPMRGMSRNTQLQLILDGFVFFYNYLRPHMGLDGKTPADVGGAGYPYKSWGDVVESQLPELKITKETRVAYRVRKKVKSIRRAQIKKRTQTSLGEVGR
jgi:putative transposase